MKLLPFIILIVLAMNSNAQTEIQNNIFGETLIPCCYEPMTGIYRDGYCTTNVQDRGVHVVCAIMTAEFLDFSKCGGNDLITPIPQYNFPGLQPGDKWCLCASRWYDAVKEGKAPKIVLEATNEKVLDYIPMEVLVKYAYKKNH